MVGPASSFALFQSGIMGPNCLPEYKIIPEGEFITESTTHIAKQRELFICGALIFADLELAAQFDALTHVG